MVTEIVDLVFDFMDRTAAQCGELKARDFKQTMHANCLELGISSPIEHLFWIACVALCEAEGVLLNPAPNESDPGYKIASDAAAGIVFIKPQISVGPYRADFRLEQIGIGPGQHGRPVIVELDGHAFHDKDKRQRAYEKGRDRFLVKAGYRVLHFTGSEVVADPFRVAYEALDLLDVFSASCRTYEAADPLGLQA